MATLDADDHAAIRGDIISILREQEVKNLLTGTAHDGSKAATLELWREPEIANVIAANAERAVVAHPAIVDTKALATALAPLINSAPSADLAALGKVVGDELARRLAS